MGRDGEVKQRQHFYHHGDTICHPKSGSYRRRIPATLIWPLKSIAGGCQSSEMAALLNSLSFAFPNSFLPKYRVKYYDYIVKWCSGV